MHIFRKKGFCVAVCLLALSVPTMFTQTANTGRIAGVVRDQTGAVIAAAEVTLVNTATSEERKVKTNSFGYYAASLLAPGSYKVSIIAEGFRETVFDDVQVTLTETVDINPHLSVAGVTESIDIQATPSFIEEDGPQMGRVVNSRFVQELPSANRNVFQVTMGLSPGTSVRLPDLAAVGHNSQHLSVNGSRVTQHNVQMNGVDANYWMYNILTGVPVPAPESIEEFKVLTSLYDATYGRSGGGNIQMVTKSGSNEFHGTAYEYLQNDALNANNPSLKAAGVARPALRRNVFGATLGGPMSKKRTFFFASYQGAREDNAASLSNLSSNIPIADCTNGCLTDDRSEQTLLRVFHPKQNGEPARSIDPIALTLLNAKLPNGQFLIPTPQSNGLYSGSTPSTFREDQFNANMDFHLDERNSVAAKFFFSNGSTGLPFGNGVGPNLPGFGLYRPLNNRVVSIQHIHGLTSHVINDARVGYNFIRNESFPLEPIKDVDVGIHRSNAGELPGLPLIRINPAGGAAFGTAILGDLRAVTSTTTLIDSLAITTGRHNIRTGADVRYYAGTLRAHNTGYGRIDFNSFEDFLNGSVAGSALATGIGERIFRAADDSLFVQDDWKVSSGLTVNLGLRYELDLPPYDTRGRISTFDPALYKPRMAVDKGMPVGPPFGGFVQAGNVIPQYDLPDVPNVGKRVLKSIDPNNFGPRVGFAYSPFPSDRVVLRSGYGVFYSRTSNWYLARSISLPPNWASSQSMNPPSLSDPFFNAPSQYQFPMFVLGVPLSDPAFDRNARTPYFHQYNLSLQYALARNLLLETAYVGTRGLNLFRVVGINQPPLASPQHPITNEVTGEVITTNTLLNASLRAPFQGVTTNFGLNQSSAQSTYNSLQMSLTKRLSSGSQFLASYTYAKSIDNTVASTDSTDGQEGAFGAGNQLDNRANRGPSEFDQRHRFALSYLWELPFRASPASPRPVGWLTSDWQLAGIVIAMSGSPIDLQDSGAGSLYGLGGRARPNFVPGVDPYKSIPPGYYFNPFAFARPVVQAGQPIPSSGGTAVADATGTDIGTVGRNVLRGPRQTNIDFSIFKRFRIHEIKKMEFRAEFYNILNAVNRARPNSNLNAPGSAIDSKSGQIINPGEFGRIRSVSNNPRLVQIAVKFNY